MSHICCSPECAAEYAKRQRVRKGRAEGRQIRSQIREQREKLKTRQQWLKEAQSEVNKYIRYRDELAGLPCISCGRHHSGSYDAGHYRSVSAAPQLRFDEANVHRQCVPCNQHKSGNAIEYRKGLVARIGAQEVERIESDSRVVKWSIEDAKRIKAEYKDKSETLKERINELQ
jgi:hypothetical protein